MEPIINQQMPTPETKNKTWLWIIIVILVAGLVGAGVYYWQSMEVKKIMSDMIDWEVIVRNEASAKISQLEADLNTEKEKNESTTLVDYKNLIDKIQLKYPSHWNISVEKDGWLFSGAEGHFWLKIIDNSAKLNANGIKEDDYKNDEYGYQYVDTIANIANIESYKQARYDLGVIERYFIPRNNKIINLNFEFNFATPDETKTTEIKNLINNIIASIKLD